MKRTIALIGITLLLSCSQKTIHRIDSFVVANEAWATAESLDIQIEFHKRKGNLEIVKELEAMKARLNELGDEVYRGRK